MRTRQRALNGALVAAALLACQAKAPPADSAATPPATTDSTTAPLVGRGWTLVTLNGQPAPPGAGNRPATLLLTPGGDVSGFGGCNRFAGKYTLSGESLKFSPLIMTRMACDAGMDLEQKLATALGSVGGYRISGDTLELIGPAGVVAGFTTP